jgi:hypothetical protein
MASVYKSVSKTKSNGSLRDDDADNKPKNRQRLLILSSRGVTYRSVLQRAKLPITIYQNLAQYADQFFSRTTDIATSSPTSTRSSRTVAKTPNSTPKPSFTN